jgi:hypothetical protein
VNDVVIVPEAFSILVIEARLQRLRHVSEAAYYRRAVRSSQAINSDKRRGHGQHKSIQNGVRKRLST